MPFSVLSKTLLILPSHVHTTPGFFHVCVLCNLPKEFIDFQSLSQSVHYMFLWFHVLLLVSMAPSPAFDILQSAKLLTSTCPFVLLFFFHSSVNLLILFLSNKIFFFSLPFLGRLTQLQVFRIVEEYARCSVAQY